MRSRDFTRLTFEEVSFLALVVVVSVAFVALIAPYFGAILWALVAAILFSPTYHFIHSHMPRRHNLAAFITLMTIIAVIILPTLVVGMALTDQASALYSRIQTGAFDLEAIFKQVHASLPDWAHRLLARMGMADFARASETITNGIVTQAQNLAGRALQIGQSAFNIILAGGVMLYLTFFLLRDGTRLMERFRRAIPLEPTRRDALIDHFVVVVRATIKGSVVVAILQGFVGGVVFWFIGVPAPVLWGVVMGVFSFFPAVGTGIVWVPVAILLLVAGQTWQGLFLVFCGFFVIGLIDNVVRPVLVGHDARMPDFVVLISTLGGLQMFGISGFIVGPLLAALFLAAWDILTEVRTVPANDHQAGTGDTE